MAHVQSNKLTPQELAQLSCTYAALILHDDGQDITGQKLGRIISASGVKIETYWPKLFAKALNGKDITSFFSFGGSAASASAAGESATVVPTASVAEKKDDKAGKKPETKKEAPPPPPKEEEEDVGMGGLFD